MYPPLYARPARDPDEERKICKLAGARHAPADWILRARMITLSWAGKQVTAIAAELGCHPKTVRERLHRFNAEGLDGLGDRPTPGRPRRLTEDDRSVIIALAESDPPGRPVPGPDGALPPALVCDNETNAERLWNFPGHSPYPKDGIGEYLINGLAQVNPEPNEVKKVARCSCIRVAGVAADNGTGGGLASSRSLGVGPIGRQL